MGVFFGGPDANPLLEHVSGRISGPEFDQLLDREIDFERMLHRENTLIVKFWLHLSRRALKKRLRKLEADPDQRWRVTRKDWKLYRRYDRFHAAAEHMIRRTSTGAAPWHIIEGADRRYRNLTVGQALLGRWKRDWSRFAASRRGRNPGRSRSRRRR